MYTPHNIKSISKWTMQNSTAFLKNKFGFISTGLALCFPKIRMMIQVANCTPLVAFHRFCISVPSGFLCECHPILEICYSSLYPFLPKSFTLIFLLGTVLQLIL